MGFHPAAAAPGARPRPGRMVVIDFLHEQEIAELLERDPFGIDHDCPRPGRPRLHFLLRRSGLPALREDLRMTATVHFESVYRRRGEVICEPLCDLGSYVSSALIVKTSPRRDEINCHFCIQLLMRLKESSNA